MNTSRETCERIDLSLHHPVRIVTGETHLPVGTVADQKILRDLVDGLHVGRVATGAFDTAVDEFHSAGGIGGLPFDTSDATRLGASFMGVTRLKGCEPVNVVPKESTLFMSRS
jgi:hypothetical protein